jgi:flagellar biosynthetic protein FliQ
MGSLEALELGRSAIMTGLLLCAPILIAGLVTGLLISILLAATQIQEFTLTFIPKMVMMALAGLVCGPWMMRVLVDFTLRVMSNLARAGH